MSLMLPVDMISKAHGVTAYDHRAPTDLSYHSDTPYRPT